MQVIYFYICWQVGSILLRSDTDAQITQATSVVALNGISSFRGILHCI